MRDDLLFYVQEEITTLARHKGVRYMDISKFRKLLADAAAEDQADDSR